MGRLDGGSAVLALGHLEEVAERVVPAYPLREVLKAPSGYGFRFFLVVFACRIAPNDNFKSCFRSTGNLGLLKNSVRI